MADETRPQDEEEDGEDGVPDGHLELDPTEGINIITEPEKYDAALERSARQWVKHIAATEALEAAERAKSGRAFAPRAPHA